MQFTRPFAASAFLVAGLCAQSTSVRSVEINTPGLNPNRYINLTLDGFPQHGLAVNFQGAQSEMYGMLLAKFLETAGWGNIPRADISQYFVRIDGDNTATLSLSEVLRRSLDNRVWLVTEQGSKTLEAPLVVAVGPDGVGTVRAQHVRHIRVTNVTSQQLFEDVEFGRLSGYEINKGSRTLWTEYVRVEGIPVMIVTSSTEGRPEKSAVLLSGQVSEWNDARLLDFLAGSVALRIDPKAAIKRGGEFTAVSVRPPVPRF